MLNRSRKQIMRQMFSLTAAAMLLWQSSAAIIADAAIGTVEQTVTVAAEIPASTYKNWKQYASAWANLPVGKMGGNMRSIGCAVTAAAILCAASHSDVPEGFDPGVLCTFLTKNGGFTQNGDLQWKVIPKLVPDFRYVSTKTFSSKNQRDQIAEMNSYLEQGYYVAVKLMRPTADGGSSSHFVAINRIENGVVHMFDPGSSYDVLYDKYSSSMLESMRIFRGGDSPEAEIPESPAEQPAGAYLTTDRLNLRSGAGTDHEVLIVVPKDTRIDITEVKDDWGKTSYAGHTGWLSMRFCTPAVSIFATGDYYTDNKTLTLRKSPVVTAEAVGYLPPNTMITVTAVNGDWGYCTYGEKSGWVALRYCTSNEGSADVGLLQRYTTGVYYMRLRTGASSSTAILTTLPPQTEFTVTEKQGNWGKTVYDGRIGWIYIPYCKLIADETPVIPETPTEPDIPDTPEDTMQDLYTTGKNSLRLRAEADDTSDTLAFIPTQTELVVTAMEGKWGKTIYNGKTGWVHLGFCTPITEETPTQPDTPTEPDIPDTPDTPEDIMHDLYTTGKNSLRLRAEANDTSDTLAFIPTETELVITDMDGKWGKTVYNGKEGWVHLGLCTLIAENAPTEPDIPDTPDTPVDTSRDLYTTGNNNLRLRAEANDSSDTLAYIGTNTELIITGENDGWGKTIYNGKEGWVYLAYCTLLESNLPVEDTPTEPDTPDEPTEPDIPDTPEETGTARYTTGSNNLRLRALATDASETLAYIGPDTELIVTQIIGAWGKTTYNGKEGWVYLAYCTLLEGNLPDEGVTDSQWPANLGNCVVVVDGLNVRSGAGGGTLLGSVRLGVHITVVAIEGDWAKIHWNGGMGWVCLGQYGTPYVYLAGDVTLDGVVNESDHKLMEAFFRGVALPDTLQMLLADVNGDGSVNADDRALLAEKGE